MAQIITALVFMKNHAFLFTTHKHPNLLARTPRILAQEDHYFFVHLDSKTKDSNLFEEATIGIKNVIFVERMSLCHGGISHLYCLFEHVEGSNLSTKVDEQLSAKLLDMIDASRGQEFDIVKAESVIE